MRLFNLATVGRRAPAVAPRVDRFAPEIRPAVARLAARDARLLDLAATFPALLHRLAVQPRAARTERAIATVRAGGSLKAAAFAAGLPFWTRKLPPEAFKTVAHDLPGGALFALRIANVLPETKAAAAWLAAVGEAARWGDPAAALWAARECADPEGLTPEEARLVALHAFFADRPETRAGTLAGGRWAANAGRRAAIDKGRDWLQRVYAFLALGDGPVDPWLRDGAADGFDFVAVASVAALAEEAQAMNNCVGSYAWDIAQGNERLFSVRRGGERVATLAVAFADDAPFPHVNQLKGRGNAPAPPEVWFAARRWAAAQTTARRVTDVGVDEHDRMRWIEVWRPWWLARGRFPAELPLRANGGSLGALYAHRPYRRRRRRG